MGDLGMLADLGLSEFDLGAIIDNLDLSSDQMLIEMADKIKLNPQFRKVAEVGLQRAELYDQPMGRPDGAGDGAGPAGFGAW